ncbi:metalloregulator ArsR/SmtB family transcription factor [Flagellimonas halotolerans]|uniref:Metalloregulator ArsR/SmtB family transcription factor n=1 Tax=Flagellimonas halotolerans TaxID=3112164 RepID=A0ABU6IRT3_9FLAO|nr:MULTISPECIES: metalloregulator ArsR/SmtB family transcription factor [unclassified Allomuricauda]MEC3965842.1 metalloregulator ArsR/SmtB family transcription factor [Muricauda sp. SYSU M86414]MEC4265692.1 metalloregulator ArsR/SmtB family transcription factor [Muricauda sp. SYSU M84420]
MMRRDVFNAIADPTRRDILMSLTSKKQNVTALANQFDMTRQAVSLHLKYLQECGVISIEKEGRERYCHLEADQLTAVADWLEPFKILWEKRLNKLDELLIKLKKEENE